MKLGAEENFNDYIHQGVILWSLKMESMGSFF